MRKDVECTFGILKGRFRILKSGILLNNPLSVEHIFKTCCALHNMLLEYDEKDLPWSEGVNWGGDDGKCEFLHVVSRKFTLLVDVDDMPSVFLRTDKILFAAELARLLDRDESLVGACKVGATVSHCTHSDDEEEDFDRVNEDSHRDLKAALVSHFVHQKSQDLVKWPRRGRRGAAR
jgi:hypothetical protein